MNTNIITAETTVGELVRAVPARSRIFENLDIDFCCGGKKPLAEVCQAKHLDTTTVIAMLTALDAIPATSSANPDAMTLAELCDHIEEFHHGYLREELPRLDFMTRKVAAVHGDHDPRLRKVRTVFEGFNAEMAAHTREEDEVIFPAIRQLAAANGNRSAVTTGLKETLARLEAEHDRVGTALVQLKTLTDSYNPPEWACNTFRALYDGLAKLEKNTHQHIHKENNVLFPKALAVA